MTVHFIGAGPGAADLITVRGLRLVQRCRVCLYAGSLVPAELTAEAPSGATVVDTAALSLDTIEGYCRQAAADGAEVARLHSGDPSVYGAIAEQMARLEAAGIAYTSTPGVPAFAAAAASLGRELTLPEVAQTVVLTRVSGKASPMPGGETLSQLAAGGTATLAIHLAVRQLKRIVAELAPIYGADCPAAVVYRASWPDEQTFTGRLDALPGLVRQAKITRTALVLVGPALAAGTGPESRLYAPGYRHICRPDGAG